MGNFNYITGFQKLFAKTDLGLSGVKTNPLSCYSDTIRGIVDQCDYSNQLYDELAGLSFDLTDQDEDVDILSHATSHFVPLGDKRQLNDENFYTSITKIMEVKNTTALAFSTTSGLVVTLRKSQYDFYIGEDHYKNVIYGGPGLYEPAPERRGATGVLIYWEDDDGNYWFNPWWVTVDYNRTYPIEEDPDSDDTGTFVYYLDVLKSIITAHDINLVLSTAGTMVLANRFSISDLTSQVSHLIAGSSNAVSNAITNLGSAFITGGIGGVAERIIAWYQSLTTVEPDDQGVLTFADNKALAPQEFIAGMVASAAASVIQVAGAIVSVANMALGVVVSTVGAIANRVIQSLQRDYDATRCGFNSGMDAFPAAPHGFCQFIFQFYNIKNVTDDVLLKPIGEAIEKGLKAQITVPGGRLFFGRDTDWDDPDIPLLDKWVRCEFHPDLAYYDRSELCRKVSSNWAYAGDGVTKTAINFQVDRVAITRAAIDRAWNARQPLDLPVNNDGRVTDDKYDQWVLYNLMANTYLFVAWLTLIDQDTDIVTTQTDEYTVTSTPRSFQANNTCSIILSPVTLSEWIQIDYSRSGIVYPYYYNWVTFASFQNDIEAATGFNIKIADSTVSLLAAWYLPAHGNSYMWKMGAEEWHCYSSYLSVVTNFTLVAPKYNGSTFILWVVTAAIIVVAVTVVAAVLTVTVKRKLQIARLKNRARVESAWSNLTDPEQQDPASVAANAEAYRKAVRKSNIIGKFIGDSSYGKSDYWSSGSEDTSGSESSGTLGFLTDFMSDTGSSTSESVNLNTIVSLIKG